QARVEQATGATAIESRKTGRKTGRKMRGLLPLLHRMEERAGVRRGVFIRNSPHPNPLPTRSSRGEGENLRSSHTLIPLFNGSGAPEGKRIRISRVTRGSARGTLPS